MNGREVPGGESLKWRAAYEQEHPRRERFTRRLTELLEKIIERSSVDVAMIENRTKSVVSFTEKIGRKSSKYQNPLRDITDLSGIRIITYYLEDVARVGELIRSALTVDEFEAALNSAESSADRFGYASEHYIVRLGPDRSPLPEWNEFLEMRAEIQVRTVLQHAWSSVSHKVAYKREAEVPLRLRRRLSSLSALFELADDQFSQLRADTADLGNEYAHKVGEGDLGILLDGLSLEAYLQSPRVRDQLNAAVHGAGWEILGADAEKIKAQDTRDLLNIAADLSIETVSQLDEALAPDDLEWILGELRAEHERSSLALRATIEDLLARFLAIRLGQGDGVAERIYSQRVQRAMEAVRCRL
ncbi:hypothetical protein OG548_30215 [Streptomyces sp. NBC_01356]|uniref:GTP pyrophosphokinase n=1 Tax=Streptomyces sp. NBC_01356 TaxID=2903836 RepID=UPI002E309D2E|nr:hypothetical protein [Streptomyces sp. NBC_01356]